MSDSYLPKVFEGFPELADKAAALEAGLADLRAAVDTAKAAAAQQPAVDHGALEALEQERDALQAQIASLEPAEPAQAPSASEDLAAAQDEVAHWKEKYDALAGRFDTELEAAKTGGVDPEELNQKNTLIASLEDGKDKAASEIARLAAELASSRSKAEAAEQQLTSLNDQLAAVQTDLSQASETREAADVPDLTETLAALENQVADLNAALNAKNEELAQAIATADASETARVKAAARLNALIDSLNAARSSGAA
ncbi:MAG: hypothetical protein AAF221_08855 [Pseudomonadota bacterium]